MAAVQLLVRGEDHASVLSGARELAPTAINNIPAQKALVSPDGSRIAAVGAESVDVYDAKTGDKVASLPAPGTQFAEWSATGAFLVTAFRGAKPAEGQAPAKNVQVWDVASRALVLELHQKSITKESWPVLQWAGDDSGCWHGVTNTLHFYGRAEGFKVSKKVPIKGVGPFAVAPSTAKALLAAFVPEAKGQPAAACIVDATGPDAVTLSRRSFYRATGATMLWNATSTACLFMATSDTDATNQSYYGESKLHYLPADPARADAACAVPVPKDGPVHDVRWSPAGDYFCVVAGFMPAKVTMFDDKCKPVYDLGGGPYNTVIWNPFGRFLAIAGFGNLPGDLVFWAKLNKGACKQMAATRSEAVTAQWSPCGRYVVTSTVAPRLRVDNNVRVFTYYGEKVAEKKFDVLLEAQWIPAPPGTFEDRPASPGRGGGAGAAAGGGGGGGGRAAAAAPAKPAGYRPPAMRNGIPGSGGAPSATFSLAYDDTSRPGGRIKTGPAGAAAVGPTGKPVPPGAEFVSKAAAKNAKKRANKKAKGPGGEDEGDDEPGSSSGAAAPAAKAGGGGGGGGGAAAAAAAAAGVAALSVADGAAAGDAGDALAKKIRALHKKLRQIQQLKERRDTEGEAALEREQLQKIAAEASVQKEIAQLEAQQAAEAAQ